MRVLVACEFSGRVRDAFRGVGHDAWSCDIIPCDVGGPHIQRDAIEVIGCGWDMMIAFPPCTHLCVTGARWFEGKLWDQCLALGFVKLLMGAPIPKIAIENPVGIISTRIRKPDQMIHPWQFGHGESKRTHLWLKGLPPLEPTCVVGGRANRWHLEPPHPERWKRRSITYQGIADAMAEQWG